MTVKLLTEQNLEFLSLEGGCTGSSESILVKMLHCWKCSSVNKVSWYIFWFSREKVRKKKLQEKVKLEHIRNLHAVSAFLKVCCVHMP